jgi:hypothetical protein
MAVTEVSLQPGTTLAATLASIVSATQSNTIRQAVFANPTATSQSLVVQVTRSGGAVTTIIPTKPIASNATYLATELVGLVLQNGDGLMASGVGITCFVSGFAVS